MTGQRSVVSCRKLGKLPHSFSLADVSSSSCYNWLLGIRCRASIRPLKEEDSWIQVTLYSSLLPRQKYIFKRRACVCRWPCVYIYISLFLSSSLCHSLYKPLFRANQHVIILFLFVSFLLRKFPRSIAASLRDGDNASKNRTKEKAHHLLISLSLYLKSLTLCLSFPLHTHMIQKRRPCSDCSSRCSFG